MVAPPNTPPSDWSGWQWKQQWDDDGYDKVDALVRRVGALETRLSDFRTFYEGQFEKQERDHQEFFEKQERVFLYCIDKVDQQQRHNVESLEKADERLNLCLSADERLTQLEQINLQDREESMALLERDHADLQQKFEDMHEAHNEMWERFETLEVKFSDEFLSWQIHLQGTSQAAAAPATVLAKITAPAPPQQAPPAVNLAPPPGFGAAPAPPQHAPPAVNLGPPPGCGAYCADAPVVPGGMIYDSWMPEHPQRILQAPPPPPAQQGCQHNGVQWFTQYFDPDSSGSQCYYVGSRDAVGPGHQWNNELQKKIASMQTVFELPWNNSLYATMMGRPDMYFCWHNPNSGAFYLSIGCANCNLRTDHYMPQYQVDLVDNPDRKQGKALKELECVKSSFRVFFSAVLDKPELAEGEKCRHYHQDTPPLALENLQ